VNAGELLGERVGEAGQRGRSDLLGDVGEPDLRQREPVCEPPDLLLLDRASRAHEPAGVVERARVVDR
jgi:hypothetical protein